MTSWDYDNGSNMTIEQYCKKYNLPFEHISSWKAVTHTGTPFYNTVFREVKNIIADSIGVDAMEEIIAKYIKPLDVQPLFTPDLPEKYKEIKPKADRCVYTDVHIGMDTDKDGTALYPTKWNEEELMKRCDEMVDYIIKTKTADILILDELGDLMDGWDGMTVRKGHSLPQNMDNKKAFDVALRFKMHMLSRLVKHYDFIQCNNICEDNHAGAFGYIVNSAFKQMAEILYQNRVIVTNHERFINHYSVFNHTFVITHGKDSKNLKFGFKPNLDPKQIEKIDQYMKQNGLYDGKKIEFSKGDSHQLILDMASSDDFEYMNYLAFSPSSEWVQTNFKKGRSGFVLQHLDGEHKTIQPYFFK